jgi:hypothetical protein
VATSRRRFDSWEIAFASIVFAAGLAVRLRLAYLHYLNPDEVEAVQFALGTWRQTLDQSLWLTHPPLLVLLTHVACQFSRAEIVLRLVPVLAGSLFPLLLFLWLRRLAGTVAGLAALLLLTLSPYAIALSVEVRPYTLALFFVAASLLVLEGGLESGRWQNMAFYSILLWLAILSDYSAAWFVGAAGVYVLLRLRPLPTAAREVWIAGQFLALVLYGALFAVQISRFSSDSFVAQDALGGWLRNEFPQAGQMLSFPLTHTLGQFEFLLASAPLGWLGAGLFAAAIFLLWTGQTSLERSRARPLALLLVLPFLLGIAGAYAHKFPYGATRHTILLGLFGAVGMAICCGSLPGRIALPAVWGMLLLAPLWSLVDVKKDIPPDRHQKWQLVQCLDYMRTAIPPGSLIFTERETLNVLAYYLGHDQRLPEPGARQYFSENLLAATWRVATRDYFYGTREDYLAALAAFRRQYGLTAADPVWVLDGGWSAVATPPDPHRPFTRAVRVFQAGEPGQP